MYKTRYEQPESIGGPWGLTDTRNAALGSDSVESANAEIGFFFPEFNIPQFESQGEKDMFMKAKYELDRRKFVHLTKL